MADIRNLEPKTLWKHFYHLTRIPRTSKHENKAIDYVKSVGEELDLETKVDDTGNVLIKKPAQAGRENSKTLVLQAHLDMVGQKNNDKNFDFKKDPIETLIDGDWVTAKGTTLGADNGIGAAAILAVLESNSIEHGHLEALFTVDEETGLTGAFGLRPGYLGGDILINTDSEDEGIFYIGCAGGLDVVVDMDYIEEETPENMAAYWLNLKGLKGGHSGMDISLGRANANQLLFRFLLRAESDFDIRLSEAEGGNARNAIPREAGTLILVSAEKASNFEAFLKEYEETVKNEYSDTEPDLSFTYTKTECPQKVASAEVQYRIIRAVFACPHGVERMSPSVPELVETSNNLAIVTMNEGSFHMECLIRSSVDTAKMAMARRITGVYQLIGAKTKLARDYPGWKPDLDSPILKTAQRVYQNSFGKAAEIKAVHAGLECGVIGGKYPGMDMLSFGPTIRYPHSPDEKVHIESVGKFWKLLVSVLREID